MRTLSIELVHARVLEILGLSVYLLGNVNLILLTFTFLNQADICILVTFVLTCGVFLALLIGFILSIRL